MTRLLFISALLSNLYLFGQGVTMPQDGEGNIIYEEVIPVEEASKSELFLRAKKWFNSYYPNARVVIKEEDPKTGHIRGVHKFRIYKKQEDSSEYMAGYVMYTIEVFVKEGRYKYKIRKFHKEDSFYHNIERWLDSSNPIEKDWLRQVDEYARDMASKLKEGMQSGREKGIEDDW